jgi:hypothetical protein
LIKEPDNLEKALENLKAHRPIQEFIQEGKDEDPSTSYHYNQIDSWDAVLDALLDVYERNKTIPGVVAFKIKAAFSIQVEYHSKTPGHGSAPGIQGDHVRYALSLGQENKGSLIPYTIWLSRWKDEYENYSKYLHVEVQKMLEHLVDASSTMYIGITGISFHVARLRKVGALFPEVELLRTNQQIYTCTAGLLTCVLEAILIATNPISYKALKGRPSHIIPKIKALHQELFGSPLPKDFKGSDLMEDLNLAWLQ